MATVRTSPHGILNVGRLPQPANTDTPSSSSGSDHRIIAWLFRSSAKKARTTPVSDPFPAYAKSRLTETQDDWQTVANLCGHLAEDFSAAGVGLPLTGAEIDHFRRNHREADYRVGRDFLAARSELPSPLAELFGVYRHRVRLDTEAAFFVAQATGSTRVARIMADLLAIGGFANGHECVSHLTMTYAVPAAFDTSDLIDRANHEAARRLAMPIDHPAHLLKLSPDEISVLATNIAERHVMTPSEFLEKANLLAEARQDVNRLSREKQFTTAIEEGDLPLNMLWVTRICAAYVRIFDGWLTSLPEIEAIVHQGGECRDLVFD